MNDNIEQVVEKKNTNESETTERDPLEDDALLEEMVRAIVTYPEEVEVKQTQEGGRRDLTISCNPEDVGKVIGKHGRVFNMLNDFFGVVGFRNGYQVSIKVDGDTNFFRKNPNIRPPQQQPYPTSQYYQPQGYEQPQGYGPPQRRHSRSYPDVQYQGRPNGGFRRGND